jgi:hypothetical protein
MPDQLMTFDGNTVGLIVRWKTGPTHRPAVWSQHADCILSNGAPIGYFGEPAANNVASGSSGAVGSSAGSSMFGSSGGTVGGSPGGSGTVMNMKGAVYDYFGLARSRSYYMSVQLAQRDSVPSTVLLVPATAKQAAAFDGYWRGLELAPGRFSLLGRNCSTRASAAFVAAGLLPGGIPGLDTPNNLYDQLTRTYGARATSLSGYVGFIPMVRMRPGGGFSMFAMWVR